MTKPSIADKVKLKQILGYLNGPRDFALTLCPSQNFQEVHAYVDASFGIHPDGKGQTGAYVTLGEGPIFVASSKQRIVSRSSTESEIVAVSDVVSNLIWIKDFLKHIGMNCHLKVYQDNISTMRILNKGKADGKHTKHINIRYNFIKSYIEDGQLELVHIPTTNMLADLFTKAITGKLFILSALQTLRQHVKEFP